MQPAPAQIPLSPTLEAATQRLANAFTSLEAAVDKIAARPKGSINVTELEKLKADIAASWEPICAALEADVESLKQDNGHLKEENTRLSNEMNKLQHDYLDLQQLLDTASDRIDGTIRQLDLALEH